MMLARRAAGHDHKRPPLSRAQIFALLLGLSITAACAALRISAPYELRLAQELVFDEYQRLSPRPYLAVPVRIVDIDEASLARIGQWPWRRSVLAHLVDRLHRLGASVIAFDMVFPEPDRLSPSRLTQDPDLRAVIGPDLAGEIAARLPDDDTLLSAAIADRPVVLGFAIAPGEGRRRPPVKAGLAFTGEDPRRILPAFTAGVINLPEFDRAAKGIGAITLSPLDAQGVIRRIPLLWSDGERAYPSLVVEVLRVAQRQTTVLVHSRDSAPFAVTALGIGPLEIPTTPAGELRVRFSHEIPARYLSAARLLSDGDDAGLRGLVEGHIVLVGTSATGLFDWRATPLAETVPGVALHAQALEQIFAGQHLSRPDWAEPFETAWVLLLGGVVTVVTTMTAPLSAFAYGAVLAVITFLGASIAFSQSGLLLDPAFPSIVGLVLYVTLVSFRYFVSDRERRFVRHAFARYVAPSYLAEIEKDPANLRLGGQEREVTILFLDIRSFTTLSETLTPGEVVEFLNRLFDRLSADILAEGGTIDKYIGDSIMAFWNAPVRVPDHAARACRAALRIRDSVRDLNAEDAFRFRQRSVPLPDVAIGIGLNMGSALVGNMGSQMRFNYSVVGDAVNVAARVEGATKQLAADILVARSVAKAAPQFAYLTAGRLDLRGKTGRERVFVLVGDERVAASPEFADMGRRHATLLEALESDRADWGPLLFDCYELAETSFPMLSGFYRRLPERIRDFQVAGRVARTGPPGPREVA